MSNELPEVKLINSICKEGDIHVILGEDLKIFGAFQDVFEGARNYYLKFRKVPTLQILQERYGEDAVSDVAVSGPSQYYLDQVRSNYIRSQMESALLQASNVWDKDAPAKILESLLTNLSGLTKYTANVKDLNLMDYEDAERYFERLREIAGDTGVPGIPTGFESIDSAYTTGMAAGHLITMFGYTGRMKSFVALLLAIKAWEQGYKPMIVSLEMSPEEVRERAYTLMASGLFDMNKLSRGEVEPDDFKEWAKKKLANGRDFIVVSAEGIGDMTPNIGQAKIDTHKPDLVVYDYAQLMKDNAKSANMTQRMLNLSREIKMQATSNGIPIIFISAVTDEDNDKRDSPPMLSQIAWSSGIEYDSNLALAVHKYDDSNIIEVACRKNRNGPNFNFYFEVDPARGIFKEKFSL